MPEMTDDQLAEELRKALVAEALTVERKERLGQGRRESGCPIDELQLQRQHKRHIDARDIVVPLVEICRACGGPLRLPCFRRVDRLVVCAQGSGHDPLFDSNRRRLKIRVPAGLVSHLEVANQAIERGTIGGNPRIPTAPSSGASVCGRRDLWAESIGTVGHRRHVHEARGRPRLRSTRVRGVHRTAKVARVGCDDLVSTCRGVTVSRCSAATAASRYRGATAYLKSADWLIR